jgi:hypothetical protein
MNLAINIALIALGFAGAVAAIGGETWLKADAPLYKRITSRGWLSIGILLLAMALGIWKEVRLENASAADAKERERLQLELQEARKALVSVEPTVLDAMYNLTARISREMDFAFVYLQGGDAYRPISSETNTPLRLYGGDEIEYTFFCNGTNEGPRSGSIKLVTGNREYSLSGSHGNVRIAGPIGEAMEMRILNPARESNCGLKLIVRSTDRTRVQTQFASILETIKRAKMAEGKNE